jgi:hypothetical protein
MSNIVAADEAKVARATNAALWVLQAVLAFQFAGGGLLKLTGPAPGPWPAASGAEEEGGTCTA